MNLRLSLFSLCLASLMPSTLHAQFSDGVLDATFDGDGIVQVSFVGSTSEQPGGIAVQADGKTVVVGYSIVSGQRQIALARLTSTGSLDGTFGTNGRVLTNATPSDDGANAVAVQPDGKIVVAGYGNSTDFLVARYTSAGVLDSSFGTGGIVIIPVSGEGDLAYALTLQNDGKIVLAGFASIAGNHDFAVARLTTAGVLDSAFSGDGIATVNMGSSTDRATSVAVQSDGKIVLGGLAHLSGDADFALVRLSADGVLDTSFDSDGRVVTSLVAGSDYANGLVIDPTGAILAGGLSVNGSTTDFALVRYTTTGSLDASFGVGGIVFTSFGSGYGACSGLALQSDGKIIAAGYSSVANGGFGTARYLNNGTLDTTFGTGGKVSTSVGTGPAGAVGVALHADGRIAMLGGLTSAEPRANFGVVILRTTQPEISVARGTALTDGTGGVSLGAAPAGIDGTPVAFTITNPGTAQLNNLAITKGGTDAADFEVSALSATSLPAGGGSVTFTVTFSPESAGVKNATLQIASNVSGSKNPFDISLTATALSTAQDTDNDGLNDVAEFRMAALGFNWQVAQNALVDTYFATANGAGLFTSSQVGSLRMPNPEIRRNPGNGLYTLQIGVEKSTSPPGSYEPFPISAPQTTIHDGKLEFQFTSPDDVAFFRIFPQ